MAHNSSPTFYQSQRDIYALIMTYELKKSVYQWQNVPERNIGKKTNVTQYFSSAVANQKKIGFLIFKLLLSFHVIKLCLMARSEFANLCYQLLDALQLLMHLLMSGCDPYASCRLMDRLLHQIYFKMTCRCCCTFLKKYIISLYRDH